MRWWRILGLAAVGGVVAAGVVDRRRRRAFRAYDSDELRARLRQRLEAAGTARAALPTCEADATFNS